MPERYYVEVTGDLRSRLEKHNACEVSHTSKYAPWEIKTYVAFADEKQAFAFEKYLKSPSASFATTLSTPISASECEHPRCRTRLPPTEDRMTTYSPA